LLCLIIAQTSAVIGVVFEVIGVPTATVTLTRIRANLLQTSSQTIGSRIGATPAATNGLDNNMSAANCAPVSVTLLPIVLSFAAVPSNPLLTLVVGNVSAVTWFPDTSANQHVTPDLATMTNSTVYLGNDYLHVGDSEGLDISHIGHTTLHHQNVFLHYLMFFMCLILPNRCYLFKNSIVIIMFMLNFTLLCFMSRIS
jgi:hypothetical protein